MVADDVVELLDHLGLSAVLVIGQSGGGPHGLTDGLAVDLGERVPGGRYLPTTSTVNLELGRTPGAALPEAVERALLLAAGEQEGPAPVTASPRT